MKITEKERKKQRSLANLKKFKPGQSGNPKGRPKTDKCIPDILRRLGCVKPPEEILEDVKTYFPELKNFTWLEALQCQAFIYAFKGNSWAFHYIADRTEGKPIQKIELETEERIPFDGNNAEEFLLHELKRGKN